MIAWGSGLFAIMLEFLNFKHRLFDGRGCYS